jgi:hypothetical protein
LFRPAVGLILIAANVEAFFLVFLPVLLLFSRFLLAFYSFLLTLGYHTESRLQQQYYSGQLLGETYFASGVDIKFAPGIKEIGVRGKRAIMSGRRRGAGGKQR